MALQQMPNAARLLDPAALAKVARLELIARGTVEGFVTGRHKSPYTGMSVEFAEHRQYTPGDDIRKLDWRVYGKSDRYYIKQYVEETNLRATILLDASGSMKYTGSRASKVDGQPISKFEYGQRLAATLAYLLVKQQDAVGLVTFDTVLRRYIPARSLASHLSVLIEEIAGTSPGGETNLAPVLHNVAERIHRRGLVIIISDLFDEADEIVKALHHFRHRKHEVLLLHVMADEELTFPFRRWTDFRNLEKIENTIELDPRAIREAYLERVGGFVRRIETECGRMKIDYMPMCTKLDFGTALADYLADRQSRGR